MQKNQWMKDSLICN